MFCTNFPNFLFCTEESNHSLYAIVCSNCSNNTQLQNLFQSMLLQLNQQNIQADIYAGSCVPREELIHTSYIEALSQYNYEKDPDNRIHYYRASSFENTAILYPQNELSGL